MMKVPVKSHAVQAASQAEVGSRMLTDMKNNGKMCQYPGTLLYLFLFVILLFALHCNTTN